jgi:hypothetical protein
VPSTTRSTGATTEILRVWPDKIGEKIDPFAADRNVVQLVSRQQRRAAEREARKCGLAA